MLQSQQPVEYELNLSCAI